MLSFFGGVFRYLLVSRIGIFSLFLESSETKDQRDSKTASEVWGITMLWWFSVKISVTLLLHDIYLNLHHVLPWLLSWFNFLVWVACTVCGVCPAYVCLLLYWIILTRMRPHKGLCRWRRQIHRPVSVEVDRRMMATEHQLQEMSDEKLKPIHQKKSSQNCVMKLSPPTYSVQWPTFA